MIRYYRRTNLDLKWQKVGRSETPFAKIKVPVGTNIQITFPDGLFMQFKKVEK